MKWDLGESHKGQTCHQTEFTQEGSFIGKGVEEGKECGEREENERLDTEKREMGEREQRYVCLLREMVKSERGGGAEFAS